MKKAIQDMNMHIEAIKKKPNWVKREITKVGTGSWAPEASLTKRKKKMEVNIGHQ